MARLHQDLAERGRNFGVQRRDCAADGVREGLRSGDCAGCDCRKNQGVLEQILSGFLTMEVLKPLSYTHLMFSPQEVRKLGKSMDLRQVLLPICLGGGFELQERVPRIRDAVASIVLTRGSDSGG